MSKVISVVGIGRVGLPFALFLSNNNYKVYGIGRNIQNIQHIKNGNMPFIEKGAGKLLKKYVNKSFMPTTSYEVIKISDFIILTLGTPIDENMNPVLDHIDNSLDKIIPYLKKGQLIILRSTISPNVTMYVKEKIEIKTKLRLGKDLFLSFCPERIAEGNSISEIKEIPQIIGGIDETSTKKSADFFETLGIKCILTDSTSAELAKLFTNMYRYISFAIGNEFMVISENYNRNIHEIINLVNSGYKRGGLSLPGITAGPCLFKDGFFLINDNPYLDLVTASWKINESIPLFLIKKIKEKIKLKNKKVGILGLAFKPEIDDIRDSLSFKIRKALILEHSRVFLHDPYVKNYSRQKVYSDFDNVLKNTNIVIIATRHKVYKTKRNEILKLLNPNAYICDIWNNFETNKLIFQAKILKK